MLLEQLLGQLSRPTAGVELLGPFRAANLQVGTFVSLPLQVQMGRGDALYLASMWGILAVPAGPPNLAGLSLFLADSGGVPMVALGTPVPTVVSAMLGGVSLLFPPVPLITFEDLLVWATALGANPNAQPYQVGLNMNYSAGVGGIRWGIKYYLLRGQQEG
jgi:hypothetical protein